VHVHHREVRAALVTQAAPLDIQNCSIILSFEASQCPLPFEMVLVDVGSSVCRW